VKLQDEVPASNQHNLKTFKAVRVNLHALTST